MPKFLVLWELHGLEKSFLPIATLTGCFLFWICPTFSKEFLFSSFLAWRKLISENHNANSKEEGHLEKLRVQELLETVLTGIQKVLGKVDRFHFCPILKLWRLIWIEKSRNESIKSSQYIKIIKKYQNNGLGCTQFQPLEKSRNLCQRQASILALFSWSRKLDPEMKLAGCPGTFCFYNKHHGTWSLLLLSEQSRASMWALSCGGLLWPRPCAHSPTRNFLFSIRCRAFA